MTSSSTLPRTLIPAMPPMASDRAGGLAVLLALGRNALSAFPQRCLEEPVVTFRIPGGHLVIATSPEAVTHMMITHADDYVRVPFARRVLGPIVGRGLVVSEGERWRQQRRAVTPAFTPRSLSVLTPHIMRCVESACSRLQRAGGGVDLLDEMQSLSLAIAATSLFSLETEQFGGELCAMVTEYMRTLGRLHPVDVLLPDSVPTPLRWRRARFRRRWTRLIQSIIAMRRGTAGGAGPRDLFDLLAQAYGPGEPELLADEVSTMLVAGHETTALTLFWACTLLAAAPQWQAALAQEAAGCDLSPAAVGASLGRLVLTRAVVQETLRLYSPAFMTARIAQKAHEVCGGEIPAGALVLVPFWLLHRSPRWWTRPAEFDPSRFAGDGEPARFTYLPFGAGRHVCIGAQLAMTESTLALAALMRHFSLRRVDERPVMPVARITTRPDHAPGFLVCRR